MKQKTITIKPVLSHSPQCRVLYWSIVYRGRVIHSSRAIYSDADQTYYYWSMRDYAINILGATHIRNGLTSYIEKV